MDLPAPPDIPGYIWRRAVESDVSAVAELTAVIDQSDNLDFPGGPEHWRWMLSAPGTDIATDTRAVLDTTGRMVGFALVSRRATGDGTRAVVTFEVHPDHREIEVHLAHWATVRAVNRLCAEGTVGPRSIRIVCEEHRHQKRRVIESLGYRHGRTFVEMRRMLGGPMPVPPRPPEAITIVKWSPALDDAVRRASNEAFADHWGSLPVSQDEWRSAYDPGDVFRSDLSMVALAGDEVVGFTICDVDPEYNAQAGAKEVWIDRVGTVPAWRRQGLASALLLRSLVAAAQADLDRAGLSVDEDARNPASAVYERLGFTVDRRTVHYVLAR